MLQEVQDSRARHGLRHGERLLGLRRWEVRIIAHKRHQLLDVQRIGPQHQAGSDSLLTSATFLRLAATAFKGVEGMEAHRGVLYGLGSDGANELISAGD